MLGLFSPCSLIPPTKHNPSNDSCSCCSYHRKLSQFMPKEHCNTNVIKPGNTQDFQSKMETLRCKFGYYPASPRHGSLMNPPVKCVHWLLLLCKRPMTCTNTYTENCARKGPMICTNVIHWACLQGEEWTLHAYKKRNTILRHLIDISPKQEVEDWTFRISKT